ncbi:MAG: hypothetical protein M3326_09695 [Actinomycetota bacterium]|nr:hypothetical protein [Actinomycetota bacterium]
MRITRRRSGSDNLQPTGECFHERSPQRHADQIRDGDRLDALSLAMHTTNDSVGDRRGGRSNRRATVDERGRGDETAGDGDESDKREGRPATHAVIVAPHADDLLAGHAGAIRCTPAVPTRPPADSLGGVR